MTAAAANMGETCWDQGESRRSSETHHSMDARCAFNVCILVKQNVCFRGAGNLAQVHERTACDVVASLATKSAKWGGDVST